MKKTYVIIGLVLIVGLLVGRYVIPAKSGVQSSEITGGDDHNGDNIKCEKLLNENQEETFYGYVVLKADSDAPVGLIKINNDSHRTCIYKLDETSQDDTLYLGTYVSFNICNQDGVPFANKIKKLDEIVSDSNNKDITSKIGINLKRTSWHRDHGNHKRGHIDMNIGMPQDSTIFNFQKYKLASWTPKGSLMGAEVIWVRKDYDPPGTSMEQFIVTEEFSGRNLATQIRNSECEWFDHWYDQCPSI